jgi:hypothetical protein
MKKTLITLSVIIILLVLGSRMVLCGQAVTPAENIFTGKCKNFNTTCVTPLIYRHSEKCRAFFTIDTYLSFLQEHEESWEGYEETKEAIEKRCSNLSPEHQLELFQKYNVNSCSEITSSLNLK